MSERRYSLIDAVFSIVCFVLGYGFIRLCFLAGEGLGICIVAVGVLIAEFIYFVLSHKQKLTGKVICAFITTFILSLGFALTTSPQILFLNFLLVILAETYILSLSFKSTVSQGNLDYLFFDVIKSIFVIPFANFPFIWPSLFSKKSENNSKKSAGSILLGLGIAAVPMFIILALLINADVAFEAVLKSIFDFSVLDVFEEILYMGLSIPVAMYLFGVFYGNSSNPLPNTITAEWANSKKDKSRIIPRVTMIAAIVPIIVVYAAFFASQCVYFVSAFQDMLPKDFSVSEYARNGFFELNAICVINFVIICCINLFTKRVNDKEGVFLRILKAILCICTEAFVVIDIAKMLLYIERFGLTQKRVITSWFMVVLGILFMLILSKQIFTKFKITLPAVCVALAMSLLIIFSNMDGFIAKYNVNLYLTGKTDTVDISMFYELDDSAIKYVLPLLEDDDYDVRQHATSYISNCKNSINCKDWNECTIYTFEAKKLLQDVEL